jgi:hypothetical protein
MFRSWWLPWVLVLTLLLGIGAPEIYFYLSNYRPLSWDYLYSFGPDPLPVTLIGEDQRVHVYRFRPEEPLRILVIRQGMPDIERCEAGAGFARWFRLLERVGSEGPAETDGHGTEGWASLTVGDEMSEGSWQGVQFEVHIPRDGDGPVIVERDGLYHAVQDANSEAWSRIWSGCAGLGARS